MPLSFLRRVARAIERHHAELAITVGVSITPDEWDLESRPVAGPVRQHSLQPGKIIDGRHPVSFPNLNVYGR
jgi:hypothetical protein